MQGMGETPTPYLVLDLISLNIKSTIRVGVVIFGVPLALRFCYHFSSSFLPRSSTISFAPRNNANLIP